MIRGGMITLAVADVNRAARFYIETLGMKLVEEHADASIIDAGDAFLIELRQGTPGKACAVTLFPKVPLAEARSIYEMRGVTFDANNVFHDVDGNALKLAPHTT